MTVAALAYGPEGDGVYRGYIINNNKERYVVVEIYNEADDDIVFQKQIPPNRPVRMPFQEWGEGYLPDLKQYMELLERYSEKHGISLWIANVLLYPGKVYKIRYKYSDDKVFKEEPFIFFEEDAKDGPYIIQID
jgi:hypothetical protein